MRATLAVFFLLLLVQQALSIESISKMLNDERLFKVQARKMRANQDEYFYVEQRVDHFNHQDHRVWKQRYFVNETYWDRALGGPIFLQIGGEGPISDSDVRSLAMSVYAQRHGALQLALEHRFYGASNPLPMTTDNLKYLSSQQALADAAQFIEFARKKFAVSRATKVVVFGCSYPGNLAGWFKMKYPQIAAGGVANSAPVHAALDFFQYLEVVDQSLSFYSGVSCDARIQEASTQLETLLGTASGQAQVQSMFRTCTTPSQIKDIQTFQSIVIGNWQGTVQYNKEHHNPVTVSALCAVMENTTMSALQAYAAVSNSFLPPGQCMDIAYQTQLNQLQNTTAPNAGRSWFYQTCTEFGYYQTTDAPARVQPFGSPKMLPLAYYTEMCEDVYGGKFTDPTPATNNCYGSTNPIGATNILYVSGSIDPWHSLTVTKSLTPSLEAILIEGTAHCAQLFPPSDEVDPPPGLAIAQQMTDATISRWLTEAPL